MAEQLAKVYVVLLVDHPTLGVQAAFTDEGQARDFAAASPLRAYVDDVEIHSKNCCRPHHTFSAVSQP